MNINGQSKTFCLHSVLKSPFKVFPYIIDLLLCDDAFLQEFVGGSAVNVPLL
jgi:hypothetical protein